MNNDNFSQEYVSGDETRYEDVKAKEATEQLLVDEKRYGISKPKRIIIKAKLINDKD